MEVVLHRVDFWDVKVLAGSRGDENWFSLVGICPCSLESLEGGISVAFKVCVVDEIEDGSHSSDNFSICSTSNNTKEYLFKLLVLLPRPLANE